MRCEIYSINSVIWDTRIVIDMQLFRACATCGRCLLFELIEEDLDCARSSAEFIFCGLGN